MQDERSVDPDLKRLQNKTKKGAANVVTEVLADPTVQGLIKNALLRETIKNSILMACLLVGVLKLYDVAKTVIGFNWVGDFIIALLLIGVGLIYLLKSMYHEDNNGDAETSRSDTNTHAHACNVSRP